MWILKSLNYSLFYLQEPWIILWEINKMSQNTFPWIRPFVWIRTNNVMCSFLAHVSSFHRVSWNSVLWFLRNPADKRAEGTFQFLMSHCSFSPAALWYTKVKQNTFVVWNVVINEYDLEEKEQLIHGSHSLSVFWGGAKSQSAQITLSSCNWTKDGASRVVCQCHSHQLHPHFLFFSC